MAIICKHVTTSSKLSYIASTWQPHAVVSVRRDAACLQFALKSHHKKWLEHLESLMTCSMASCESSFKEKASLSLVK